MNFFKRDLQQKKAIFEKKKKYDYYRQKCMNALLISAIFSHKNRFFFKNPDFNLLKLIRGT